MRFGIFTDAHSNFEALKAVSLALKSEQVDRLIFLGDTVGYGADPNDCCRIVKEMAEVALLGNHDAVIVDKLRMDWFVDHAQAAIEWTDKVISPENREWLGKLPLMYREEGVLFCHGSPIEPSRFDYVMDYSEAYRIYQRMVSEQVGITFVGHAHIGITFRIRHTMNSTEQGDKIQVININGIEHAKVELSSADHWVVNVGAVGQPRDHDPRAVYAIFDTETRVYHVERVEYDIESASSRIEAAGLPRILAERLFRGK